MKHHEPRYGKRNLGLKLKKKRGSKKGNKRKIEYNSSLKRFEDKLLPDTQNYFNVYAKDWMI